MEEFKGKVHTLEKTMIKMEVTLESLTSKMVDVADALSSISSAVQGFVVITNRLDRVDKDLDLHIKSTREDIRDLYGKNATMKSRMEALSDTHGQTCADSYEKLDVKHDKRSLGRLKGAMFSVFAVLTFVFGYFYLDLKAGLRSIESTRDMVHSNQLLLKEDSGTMNVMRAQISHLVSEHKRTFPLEGK